MTVTTEDILQHYGVKGMKWGVRRYQPYPKGEGHKGEFLGEKTKQTSDDISRKVKLPSGETLELSLNKESPVAKTLAALSPSIKKSQESFRGLTLKDSEGKKVGTMDVDMVSPTELNVVWVGIKSKDQNKGIGRTALSAAVSYAKEKGMEKVTMEAIGDSDYMISKYEEMGFKKVGTIGSEDDVWGGATEMEYKIKHSTVTTEDILQHYGVKGMKWGIRRYQPYPKGEGPSGRFIRDKVRNSRVGQEVRSRAREARALMGKNKIHDMSTREIQQRTRRLQQENEMKRLSKSKPSLTKRGREEQRKTKQDYRNRGDMSDQELNRKVERLKAKDLYNQNANKAGKEIIDVGKRVAKSAAALGANYKTKGGVDATDVYDAIMTPEHSLVKSAGEMFGNNEHVQELLKKKLKN